MTRDWWAPLTGIAFVIVLVASFVIGGEPPDADEPARTIVQHYVDEKDSIMIGVGLTIPATVLLVFFAMILRRALRAGVGAAESVLPTAVLAGAIVIATGAGIDSSLSFALADRADDIDPIAVQALQALWDNDFIPFAIGQALFFLGAGLAIVRYGVLPKWLGWIAVLFGIAGMTPIGFFAFLGGAVWILIVSVLLTMANRTGPAAPTSAAAA